MKKSKRILFVDGDETQSQLLARQVSASDVDWDTLFLTSTEKALAALDEDSFDVVVADLHLPSKNEGGFLAEVMARHPKIARLIVSDPADQALAMGAAGVVHQYVPKPCEVAVLKGAVGRAGDLEASIRRDRIMEIVARMDRLPSLPSLYIKVVEKLKDPEVSLEDVGEIIGHDIAMTAKILKLVNSAFFGLRRQISSPVEAVNYLGLDTVKGLVLSIHAFAQFDADALGSLALEAVWNHSMQTAVCCKMIAGIEGLKGRMRDESFVAGMLHDTGKLVLASNEPERYVQALETAPEIGIARAEEAVFGVNHADIGGHLFALWGLPVPVVDAVEFHHDPLNSPETELSTLTLVHASNAIVTRHHEEVTTPGSNRPDEAYLEQLGLHDRYAEWAAAYAESLEGSVVV